MNGQWVVQGGDPNDFTSAHFMDGGGNPYDFQSGRFVSYAGGDVPQEVKQAFFQQFPSAMNHPVYGEQLRAEAQKGDILPGSEEYARLTTPSKDDGFGSILSIALPVVLAAFGVPPMLSTALGGGATGAALSGALINGSVAAFTGGNVFKSAVLGGAGGAAGFAFGGAGTPGTAGGDTWMSNDEALGLGGDMVNSQPGGADAMGTGAGTGQPGMQTLDLTGGTPAEGDATALGGTRPAFLDAPITPEEAAGMSLQPGTVLSSGEVIGSTGLSVAAAAALAAGKLTMTDAVKAGAAAVGAGAKAIGVNSVKDAIGLLGTGVGLYAGVKALTDDSSQPLKDAAKAGIENQSAIATQMAGIANEQWDLYKKNVVPLLQNLSSMTSVPDHTAEDVASAAGQTKQAYGTARENLTRALERTRSPADPGYGAVLAPTYTDEATAVARAIETAKLQNRTRVEDVPFQRTREAAAAWQGLPAGATANLSGAASTTGAAATGALNLAKADDAAAAQAAYGGFTLAKEASNWYKGTTPGTQPAAPIDSVTPRAVNPYGTAPFSTNDTAYDWPVPYADGGKVEGPGTGTSDSIKALKRPGTYILSADTVRAVGTKKLDDMMEKAGVRKDFSGGGATPSSTGVPVRLSSGEYEVPPEVTQHYGEEFFNKLQQKYHRPVASDGMANGGAIRKRPLPRMVEEAIHSCASSGITRRR